MGRGLLVQRRANQGFYQVPNGFLQCPCSILRKAKVMFLSLTLYPTDSIV